MNNNEPTKDGMPSIAEFNHKKNIVLIIFILMMVLGLFFYFHHKNTAPKPIKEMETEVYVPQPVAVSKNVASVIEKTEAKLNTPTIDPELLQQQLALIQEKQRQLQERLAAPLMPVNNNQNSHEKVISPIGSKDANTQFMQQIASQTTDATYAASVGALNSVILEGSLIHAVLESASNSDLPGYLRAIVSEPVYAEDGSTTLVPPGSRLIGQYKSGMLQGQSRFFVVWTRLITPQGLSVQLGSPGVDSLGVAGIAADEINRHFWERFGNAALLSLIGAGAANIGVNPDTEQNSASVYREAIANSFSQSANQSLQQQGMIAPTLKKYQGKSIIVFVAKDLHFDLSKKNTHSNWQIF